MKYYYKGQEISLVPGQQFSSHWNIYYNQPTENGGSRRVIVTVVPDKDLTMKAEGDVEEVLETTTKTTVTTTGLNINSTTFMQFREAFPGVGRVAAKAITQTNKPPEGYKDFDELKTINAALNINWEELKEAISF